MAKSARPEEPCPRPSPLGARISFHPVPSQFSGYYFVKMQALLTFIGYDKQSLLTMQDSGFPKPNFSRLLWWTTEIGHSRNFGKTDHKSSTI